MNMFDVTQSDATESALIQATTCAECAAALFRVDDEEHISFVHANDAFVRIAPNLLRTIGDHFEVVIQESPVSAHLERIRCEVYDTLKTQRATTFRLPFGTQSFEVKLHPIVMPPHGVAYVMATLPARSGVLDDDTRFLDSRWQERELSYQRLIEVCPIAIVVHRENKILYANPMGLTILNATSLTDILHRSVLDFLPSTAKDNYSSRTRLLMAGEMLPAVQTKLIRSSDSLEVEIRSIPIIQDGRPAILSLIEDISEQKKVIDALERLAYYDPLTELPNRRWVKEKSITALIEAELHHALMSVYFIDFDGFKEINDQFGHETGDMVLQLISSRLRDCCDETRDLLGRLAGDEFTITRQNTDQEDTERLAEELIRAFREPLCIGGRALRLGLSIGLSAYPTHALTYETLLRQADAAMYIAKERGGNRYAWTQSS